MYCFCHFFLLWAEDPLAALKEMVRVTHQNGWILALAEPDYGGRISHPSPLEKIGKLQNQSLKMQGADPFIGRSLLSLFRESGLEDINAGIISAGWDSNVRSNSLFQNDLSVIRRDLSYVAESDEINTLILNAEKAIDSTESIWFVPVFYAYGRVP
jgi:hypothetical protein